MRKQVMAATAVLAAAWLGAATKDDQEIKRLDAVMALMAREGYSKENCYLKGKRIAGRDEKNLFQPKLFPCDKDLFPYDWDFKDGTTRGISDIGGGLKDFKNVGGELTFRTTEKNNYFSWGNFDLTKPGIRLGFDRHSKYVYGRIGFLEVKLKQSLPQSVWKVGLRRVEKNEILWSEPFTVKGAGERVVAIPLPKIGIAPFTALRVVTETPGNAVAIDWIRPSVREVRPCYRKTIELPAKVRWAKVSASTYGWFKIYVNGELAVDFPENFRTMEQAIYDFDLSPSLFHPGKNVVCVKEPQLGSGVLIDGAALCENGAYVRFDSDASWKVAQNVQDEAWLKPDFDDAQWRNAAVHGYNPRYRTQPIDNPDKFFFNPSWKGQLAVSPSDGRAQPVYSTKEPLALNISVPFRENEKQPELTWSLFDEMGDYFRAYDTLVAKGAASLRRDGPDWVGEFRSSPGKLKANVAYALVIRYLIDGKEIEKRRYEFAVCGPIAQPVVQNPADYSDGMELRKVYEIDPTTEQKEGEFVSCEGDGVPRPSEVIETPLGKFRQTYAGGNSGGDTGEGCAYLSWKYRIEHPGRPHLVVADYPDDTTRCQELRLEDFFPLLGGSAGGVQLGNDTVMLGAENPLTRRIRQHHVVFFPNNEIGAVSVFSIGGASGEWTSEKAARIGKIRIYEILNDIPMLKVNDAPGERKWLFQQSEPGTRVVVQSCFTSPLAPKFRSDLVLSEAPNFYRNWMVTTINMIKRLRFAGENAYCAGLHMYSACLYPSKFSYMTALEFGYSGTFKDNGALMTKMFEENDLGLFVGLEITALPNLDLRVSDDEVADGAETYAQVDKYGRQNVPLGQKWAGSPKTVSPNWLHPKVRKSFGAVVDELLALYGDKPAFKGLVFYVVPELWCPAWLSPVSDPYAYGYDDYTIALFEKETGIRVPVDKKDRQRFIKRYDWLLAHEKKAWTDWRTEKIMGVYDWVKQRVKQTRPDLKLVFHSYMTSNMEPPVWTDADSAMGVYDYARRSGIDLEGVKNDPNMVLARGVFSNNALMSVLHGAEKGSSRASAHSDKFAAAFGNDGKNGAAVRYYWSEAQVKGPAGWLWPRSATESWVMPGGEFLADYMTNVFVRMNPTLLSIAIQDIAMWMGREHELGRFAQAFRSVPVGKYVRHVGNGLDKNVWIETATYGNDIYGYVANAQPWEIAVRVKFASGLDIRNIIGETKVAGDAWSIKLAPYRIRTFKIAGAKGKEVLLGAETEVGADGRSWVTSFLTDFKKGVTEQNEALRKGGKLAAAETLIADCETAVNNGDYAAAWEALSLSPLPQTLEQFQYKATGYEPKTAAAKQVTRPPTIDADLSDWDAPTLELNDPQRVSTFNNGEWKGPDDLSAIGFVAWDTQNLYLAVQVKDDKYFVSGGERTDDGDSVELYFDMDIAGDWGDGKYSTDDFHLKLGPPIADGALVRVDLKRGDQGQKLAIDAKALKTAFRKTNDGYVLELSIPWKNLGVAAAKENFGFDIAIIDRDMEGDAVEKAILWSALKCQCWKDPRIFGRLKLGDVKSGDVKKN